MNTTRPTISAPPEQPKPDIAYMSELWRTGEVAGGIAKAVDEREARCTRRSARSAPVAATPRPVFGLRRRKLRDRVATTAVIRRTARRSGRDDTDGETPAKKAAAKK
jgi:hypothetical protein